MSNVDKAFESSKKVSRELRLESEVQKLQALVGELTMELKKGGLLMRKSSLKVQMRNEPILGKIQALKTEHPF